MNLKTLTVAPQSGDPIVLGVVTYVDGSASGYTLDYVRANPGSRRLNVQELPLVTGSQISPGKMAERNVEVSGTIVGPDAAAVRVLRRKLIEALADRGLDYVVLKWTPENTEVGVSGYLNGAVECSDQGGHFLGYTFMVTCPDPVAYALTSSAQTIGGVATTLGNATVYPQIQVTTSAATVVIANSTTLETLTLNNMTNGVLAVVNKPGIESVTLNGVSIMDKLASGSKFLSLRPGANTITCTGCSGLMGWYNGWID